MVVAVTAREAAHAVVEVPLVVVVVAAAGKHMGWEAA